MIASTAGAPALAGAAELYTAAITAPVNGSMVKSGALSFVDIRGTLSVTTAAGELTAGAFPAAQLLLFKCAAAGGTACGDPASEITAWELTVFMQTLLSFRLNIWGKELFQLIGRFGTFA